MKNWINENPWWVAAIAGLFLGGVFIYFSHKWEKQTLIVLGLAAIPILIEFFGGNGSKPVLPVWIIYVCATIWVAFASGSFLSAVSGR